MSTAQEQKLMKSFGHRVAEIRKTKKMTQHQLAEAVNMNVVSIAYIETGKRWVRLATLIKLAKGLRVDVAELFTEF